MINFRVGQVWRPDHVSAAKPRRILWLGRNRWDEDAVGYERETASPGVSDRGHIPVRSFTAWIKKNGATCDD